MARILIALLFAAITVHARDVESIYSKDSFQFGKKTFTAYVADTESLRADGLMYVTHLKDDLGMLFVFESEQPLSFWMKNTLIPLSVAFIDAGGKIVDIQEMTPQKSMADAHVPTYQSRAPALFALEMNKGWFAKQRIKVGTKLKLLSKTKSSLLSRQLPAGH